MNIADEKKIAYILREMGMRQDIKGYKYVKYAISLTVDNESVLDAITKGLYPEVAKKFRTTPARAERAIRHAVESTFDNIPTELLHSIFGNSISRHSGKVTNSHFIAAMAELMRFIDVPTNYADLGTVTPVKEPLEDILKELEGNNNA